MKEINLSVIVSGVHPSKCVVDIGMRYNNAQLCNFNSVTIFLGINDKIVLNSKIYLDSTSFNHLT